MKYLRLILFFPLALLTMIIVNYAFDLIINLINLFVSEPRPMWSSFLKSLLIPLVSTVVAVFIYPLDKKLLPLVTISIFFIILNIIFVYGFYYFEDIELPKRSKLSQLIMISGNIVGLSVAWKSLYFVKN